MGHVNMMEHMTEQSYPSSGGVEAGWGKHFKLFVRSLKYKPCCSFGSS